MSLEVVQGLQAVVFRRVVLGAAQGLDAGRLDELWVVPELKARLSVLPIHQVEIVPGLLLVVVVVPLLLRVWNIGLPGRILLLLLRLVDLTDFALKPYVSYRTEEVQNTPFTAKDLFDQVYAQEVERTYLEKNIETFDVPSDTIDQARLKALQTGSDLFEADPLDGVRAPIELTIEL